MFFLDKIIRVPREVVERENEWEWGQKNRIPGDYCLNAFVTLAAGVYYWKF
ncbi:hypothetical protein NXH76_04825 [Blautia schinkii]|nr:hypothetical protein [Blautia schinkii]